MSCSLKCTRRFVAFVICLHRLVLKAIKSEPTKNAHTENRERNKTKNIKTVEQTAFYINKAEQAKKGRVCYHKNALLMRVLISFYSTPIFPIKYNTYCTRLYRVYSSRILGKFTFCFGSKFNYNFHFSSSSVLISTMW